MMNNDMMKQIAQYGRNGDSQLVHMRPDEVKGLGLLAELVGGGLTTNPKTGYPEAWRLPGWVLPVAAIAATVMTGGAAAPVAAGALGAGGAAAGGAALAGGAAAAGTGAALGAGAAGVGALGAGAAGAGAAGASGAAGGLLAAEGAAGGLAAAEAATASGGLLGSQSAAPVVEAGQSAGFLDKANYAMGNTFSTGGTGANLINNYEKVAKITGPVNSAIQAATPPPEEPAPMMPPIAPQIPGSGPQSLSALAGQNQQYAMQQQQSDIASRERRKQQIARMGGLLA